LLVERPGDTVPVLDAIKSAGKARSELLERESFLRFGRAHSKQNGQHNSHERFVIPAPLFERQIAKFLVAWLLRTYVLNGDFRVLRAAADCMTRLRTRTFVLLCPLILQRKSASAQS